MDISDEKEGDLSFLISLKRVLFRVENIQPILEQLLNGLLWMEVKY